MSDPATQRGRGSVFNDIAADYDRHRPTYPDQLLDRACDIAGLSPGDEVLEIGCGTGQLTGGLLARGLRVTAIEPGEQLVKLARRRLRNGDGLRIVNSRLEDATLPHARFQAAFSASAIHWVDPDVGWRRVADSLASGATLALVQYVGLRESRSAEDQQALFDAMAAIAPEIAEDWPRYRDLQGTLDGVRERRENVSEAWSWLGDYRLGRDYVADLFDQAQIVATPMLMEHTAAELTAALGTMSFWARLSSEQRDALESASSALQKRLGRPIKSSVLACLVTARRS